VNALHLAGLTAAPKSAEELRAAEFARSPRENVSTATTR
jgi:hypothetical protein